MKIALKGSPSWSINQDGEVSVSTTWQCYNDATDNVAIGWLRFQNEVEQFAGKAGDLYKAPVQDDNAKEATKYETSNAFIVQSVEYKAVDARTHYEVTFEHIQNFTTMTRIGDVTVEVNENNEKVKTIRYKVSATGASVDSIIMHSGDTADWAGELYQIQSSSYSPESAGIYNVEVTAVDMSYMRIGLPSITTDTQGNTVINTTWRYSKAKYEETTLPNAGEDATQYVGKPGYVITNVQSEPQGVLGYNVTITASSHITHKVLSSRKTVDRHDKKYTTTWETTFQADDTELRAISDAATYSDIASLLPEGKSLHRGVVESIQYDQYAPGKYNVSVRLSDNEDNDIEDMDGGWSASVSEAYLQLSLQQAGWSKGPSGELYRINFPPTTRFRYTMTPDSLIGMQTASGNTTPTVTSSELLSAIKRRGVIGYDRIVGVQGTTTRNELKWLSNAEIANISSLSTVHSIMLEGFVYAQPSMTKNGSTVRNQLFTAWDIDSECPLNFGSESHVTIQGRYVPLHRRLLKYRFKYHEISVTQTYHINPTNALKQNASNFYNNAIAKIRCSNYTSYKAAGISFALRQVADSEGNISNSTEVTCVIHALLSTNAHKPKWNRKYDGTVIVEEGTL